MNLKNKLTDLLAEYDNSQIDEAEFINKAASAIENNSNETFRKEVELEFIKSSLKKYSYDVSNNDMYQTSPIETLGNEAKQFSELIMKGRNDSKK